MYKDLTSWDADGDMWSELGAAPKKKKPAAKAKPAKAKPAPKAKAPKKAKAAPKPKAPKKAKAAPKPKAPKKAKAAPKPKAPKKAKPAPKAKAPKKPKAAKPAKKTPTAKKLAALPPAKKAVLRTLVKTPLAPAPARIPATPPPDEAEVPEPALEPPEESVEETQEEAPQEEEATDMEEEPSEPEDDSSGEGEEAEEPEDPGEEQAEEDQELGALAISKACQCSKAKAKKARTLLDKRFQKRGYPPGTSDKLLANLIKFGDRLSSFNRNAQKTLQKRRGRSQADFQRTVLARLGSTASKLPKKHPTRKRAGKLIAKHISGILLSTR